METGTGRKASGQLHAGGHLQSSSQMHTHSRWDQSSQTARGKRVSVVPKVSRSCGGATTHLAVLEVLRVYLLGAHTIPRRAGEPQLGDCGARRTRKLAQGRVEEVGQNEVGQDEPDGCTSEEEVALVGHGRHRVSGWKLPEGADQRWSSEGSRLKN